MVELGEVSIIPQGGRSQVRSWVLDRDYADFGEHPFPDVGWIADSPGPDGPEHRCLKDLRKRGPGMCARAPAPKWWGRPTEQPNEQSAPVTWWHLLPRQRLALYTLRAKTPLCRGPDGPGPPETVSCIAGYYGGLVHAQGRPKGFPQRLRDPSRRRSKSSPKKRALGIGPGLCPLRPLRDARRGS
jgi:hypothetical protein